MAVAVIRHGHSYYLSLRVVRDTVQLAIYSAFRYFFLNLVREDLVRIGAQVFLRVLDHGEALRLALFDRDLVVVQVHAVRGEGEFVIAQRYVLALLRVQDRFAFCGILVLNFYRLGLAVVVTAFRWPLPSSVTVTVTT